MSVAGRITEYYEALREGDPLAAFFAREESLVKFGISEQLVGYEAVAAGLREQTASTRDWRVDSQQLRVTERSDFAWFSDVVNLAWTDVDSGTREEFDSRWSGTLERRDGEWRFVAMHVSAPLEV